MWRVILIGSWIMSPQRMMSTVRSSLPFRDPLKCAPDSIVCYHCLMAVARIQVGIEISLLLKRRHEWLLVHVAYEEGKINQSLKKVYGMLLIFCILLCSSAFAEIELWLTHVYAVLLKIQCDHNIPSVRKLSLQIS